MSPQDRLAMRHHPDVIGQQLGDVLVLIHLSTDRIYELNATAARIWELLRENGGTGDLSAVLEREFAVDRGHLRADLEGFTARLSAERLLTIR